MIWRRQPPAWSPVTLAAIAAGAFAPARGARWRAAIQRRVRAGYGAAAVRLTDSGTSALALAIRTAPRKGERPRVAMPAWACYDLMTAADEADAEVILYDVNAESLEPAEESFRAALRQGPGAVVVAHWFGIPVSVAPLISRVHDAGAVFIEDAAQGVGGSIGGRPLGSFGDFGILSFGRGKGRTGGRGGALLANSAHAASLMSREQPDIADADSRLRGLAALAAQWAVGRPWLYAIPSSIPSLKLGETIYHAPSPIREMAEWSAAVVDHLWDRAELEASWRRESAARWTSLVGQLGNVQHFGEPRGSSGGWLRYPVLVRDPIALRDDTARALGVMPGYTGLLAGLPLAPGRLVNAGPWPGATELGSRLRTLPNHRFVSSADVRAIVQLLGSSDPRRS